MNADDLKKLTTESLKELAALLEQRKKTSHGSSWASVQLTSLMDYLGIRDREGLVAFALRCCCWTLRAVLRPVRASPSNRLSWCRASGLDGSPRGGRERPIAGWRARLHEQRRVG
jgi:hypothetical protein